MQKNIDTLSEFENIFIYSPHFDDAFLSLGGYLSYCKDIKKIKIIVVFSKCLYRNKHKLCFDEVEYVSELRKNEELLNIGLIKGELIVLDYKEAIIRGYKLNKGAIIPNNILKSDYDYICAIENDVKLIIESAPKSTLHLFPFAIGKHIDHKIVKNIGFNLLNITYNIGFYEDMPYAGHIKDIKMNSKFEGIILPVNSKDKVKYILSYSSQNAYKWIDVILKYMLSIKEHEGNYVERIWLRHKG